MKQINIFCFGFGQVAKSFIKKLHIENYNINLSTTSRSITSEKTFSGVNYINYQYEDEKYDKKLLEKLSNADHILVSIPPKEGRDIVIKNFSETIEKSNPKWITYLSATSVYGDHQGEWVDENSKTYPTSSNGIARLQAEKSWIYLQKNKNLSIQVLRLAGIYSNESNILVRLKLGNVEFINKNNHYFSRIHVDDIANILFKSLSNFKPGEIYNISDDWPASSEEVTLYGAKILNIQKLKKIEVDDIKSEMLKSFYKESKKVNNNKMKNFFKYSLKFPSYVEGLNHIRNNFF